MREDIPAQATAALLPLLLSAEESAAHAFDRLGRRCCRRPDCATLLATLDAMTADERRHESLLRDWQRCLPPVPEDPALAQRARTFFASLASRDPGLHFARIAALDSALCRILRAFRLRQPQLYHGPLSIIARDEAHHVAVSARWAIRLTSRRERSDAAAATRAGLAALLAARSDQLDALGLQPDRLLPVLADPPRFLCR